MPSFSEGHQRADNVAIAHLSGNQDLGQSVMQTVIVAVLSSAKMLRQVKPFQRDIAMLILPWHDQTVQNAVSMRAIRQRSLGKLLLGLQ
jgi:hypothetical protein